MFHLIHLSDCHLAPLPKVGWHRLFNKRFFGYCNWQLRRKHSHKRSTIEALCGDILKQKPDHIAVTGDLVNLALPEEFHAAQKWLETLGPPDKVSVVPGNHDAYVSLKKAAGFQTWSSYMQSNETLAGMDHRDRDADEGMVFPYIRTFKTENIVLIGLSSAVPTAPFMATGELGQRQCEQLSGILSFFARKNFYRIILLHHPPLKEQTLKNRGLLDSALLAEVLTKHGAELILHGHNHTATHETLTTNSYGDVTHILGVPSASCSRATLEPLAGYSKISLVQKDDDWVCKVTRRGFQNLDQPITDLDTMSLY